MSKQSSSSFLALVFAVALAGVVGACAQGAEGTGSDDDPIDAARIDAPNNPNIDARPQTDARLVDAPPVPIDAPISLPDGGIDLDGGLPGTCTTNAECTAPGTCCFVVMCVAGTPLPAPINCLPS